MSIRTIFETKEYSYDHDSLYGTGWWVRKADDFVSLMETGINAVRWKNLLTKFENTEASKNRFNNFAAMQTYQPRWQED